MTTIAYKDGVIATDSMISAGNTITDQNAEKRIVRDGIQFFIAGATSDHIKLVEEYINPTGRDVCSAGAFVVDGEMLYRVGREDDGKGIWRCPLRKDNPAAMGSGQDFALAAMDFGNSAEKAVLYARTRDLYTGGPVWTYNITENT